MMKLGACQVGAFFEMVRDNTRARLLASSSFSSIPNGDQLIVTEDVHFYEPYLALHFRYASKVNDFCPSSPLSSHPSSFLSLPPPHSPFYFETSIYFFDARSSGNLFFQASRCSGCCSECSTRGGRIAGTVLQRSSAPPLDLGKVINSFFRCSGSHPLWSVRYAYTGSIPAEIHTFVAIVAWKLYSTRKRRKARAQAARAARFSIAYGTSEKPSFVSFADMGVVDGSYKVALPPPIPSDPDVRWVPQIRSVTLPSGVAVPPVAVTAPERSPKLQQDGHPPTPNSGPSSSPVYSPPPAYRILGLNSVPVPPTPPESSPTEMPPPTPMHGSAATTAATPTRESFDLPPVPSPSPSPRSTSFQSAASTPSSAPRAGIATMFTPKSLPRLMQVTTSFEPSRSDELSLRVGETLRLIKEFEDEWCLVQRIGAPDAEKGVVPTCCLAERPRIIKNRATLSGLTFNGARRK